MLRKQVIRYARLGVGTLLVLFGVVGGFVPILQGWIFVLAGLSLMAPESRSAKRLLEWARNKAGAVTKSARATKPSGAGSTQSGPGCAPGGNGD